MCGDHSLQADFALLIRAYSCLLLVQACGGVVQLVRTLPRRWLESHTVTADTYNTLPFPAHSLFPYRALPHLECIRANLSAVTSTILKVRAGLP